MRTLAVLLIAAFAGCATTTTSLTSTSLSQTGNDELVLLGNDIVLSGGSESCKTRHYSVEDRHSFLPDRMSYTLCTDHPTHITVTCSAPCTITRDSRVTPAVLGPFTVFATITRDDTGAVKREAFTYTVVMPDALALSCGQSDAPRGCATEGVRAERPFVRPLAVVKGHLGGGAMTVNGRPVDRFGATSLATLFPARATAGGGVEPGVYPVVVAFREMTARYEVVAR